MLNQDPWVGGRWVIQPIFAVENLTLTMAVSISSIFLLRSAISIFSYLHTYFTRFEVCMVERQFD